ncbi:hypothetical protein PHYBLDRAFT_188319 [Phycomyces blakesleeanus NRRL 1555(-)]|uniref:Uncharacterized protein n=2 Tax=Phycomyces blakesleeanus TaxID=4837 RepID=A0A162TM81_PHYB8|nr:hypothetical protein PHYBLDRAFT_188319 [Phycomyces blakesleeanus NRRL 1555(-)]OAD69632.1 hypothetical protein PHYBLDRAFT_188319 [Phycomyces blakesleeanus NRRL 1555(-)]|eukprot:XP_018287672.1 hypothetical protein PHYBLDRAFT_188319 [Phycomyces blakesleeanus NRRL 1555(-)]
MNNAIQDSNQDTIPNESQSQSSKKTPQEINLSLIHYILVSPFAALYIVGRALLDVLRLGVYWILWLCEQAGPRIDNWLFETVTESIPSRLGQLERWWNDRGLVWCRECIDYINKAVLPAVVTGVERGFGWFCSICAAINVGWTAACHTYTAIVNMHDWQALFLKIWRPLESFCYRTHRILVLVYRVCYSGAISLWEDIRSIYGGLSLVFDTVRSSWLAGKIIDAIRSGVAWSSANFQPVLDKLHKQVILPVLTISGVLAVYTVERIARVLESDGFRTRILRFRQALFSNLVWAVLDLLDMVKDINIWVGCLINTVVVPTVILFVQHLLPRLSKAHQRLRYVAIGVFENQVYPVWVRIYPHTRPLLELCHKICALAVSQDWIVERLGWLNKWAVSGCRRMIENVGPVVYSATEILSRCFWSVCEWMGSQAPLVAKAMEQMRRLVEELDWAGLQRDGLAVYWVVYDAVSVQSDLLFGSLERALTTCELEQSTAKSKGSKQL